MASLVPSSLTLSSPAPTWPTLAALVLGLFALACKPPAEQAPATMVFAAASLTAPFQALAEEFESGRAGTRLELHFAGTPQLVVQIREGAPADVFASADEVNMQRVLDSALALAEPHLFASNRLAIIAPKGNPKGLATLADLGREDLTVLLCGPEVPAGRYARQALAKAGVELRSASDEPSVRAVVSKVGLGEADAGIVYRTDAASARNSVASLSIPDEHDVIGRYPIVALASGHEPATARAFVDFVLSARGQAILGSFGFSGP
jgi:molybdate transport system substrate-binding protein